MAKYPPEINGDDVEFESLPDGAIPAIGSGINKTLTDSGGRYLPDGTTFLPKLGVSSESIDVGAEVILTDNAASVGFRRNSDGMSRSIPSVKITNEGYERLVRQEFKELETIDLNVVEAEVNTSQYVQFDYQADFEFVSTGIMLRVTGEVQNFQLTVQKQVDGVFKTIRYLVPPSSYAEGYGGFIVDALPAEPDDRADYYIRNPLTNDVTIDIQDASLVEVDQNDDPIVFRMIWETTDPNGMQMSGVTADIGFGTQFYPYLRSTGYDTTRITIADRRDVARRFSEISADRTYTTKNDFYRNRHQLTRFNGSYTLTYATPDLWEEGDSLEVYSVSGTGVLVINGYTINGAGGLNVQINRRYRVTYEDNTTNNFVAIELDKSPIVVSDQSLKTNVASIPAALLSVWGMHVDMKSFQLTNGDPRTHTGVIAQDVIAAFNAAGLDFTQWSVIEQTFDGYYLVNYDELHVIEMAYIRSQLTP